MKRFFTFLLCICLLMPISLAQNLQEDMVDLAIVGAGGAGMSAAIEARIQGVKNLVIFEKMGTIGGNTIRSTAGLNACQTQLQEQKGVEDSVDLMVSDTLKGGKNLNDKQLVRQLASNSASAVDFINSLGGDLNDLGILGGASVERAHRPSGGSKVGAMLVSTLKKKIDEYNLPILLNSKVLELIKTDFGYKIKYQNQSEEKFLNARTVIIATGGFSANSDMVVNYVPSLKGFTTTNHSGATGDGILLAQSQGADLVDMDQIQTHPTVDLNTSEMYTEAVRGNGGILINSQGRRFINELETRDVVSKAILEQSDAYAYLFFDDSVRQSLKSIDAYIKKGIITQADSLEELANKLNMDEGELKKTVEDYNNYQSSADDKQFSRANMSRKLDTPPYYVGKCAPAVHHTMGGIKINKYAEVLDKNNNVIDSLFACGEVVGGVHGANRLGGNAVADIVVFGRIAAQSAAAKLLEKNGFTAQALFENANIKFTPKAQGNFKDGEYKHSSKGHEGMVDINLKVENGNIVDIFFGENRDTLIISDFALLGISKQIIENQSIEALDAVSGATETSKAIIESVNHIVNNYMK